MPGLPSQTVTMVLGLDVSIISLKLHHFQMDNSNPLELQINIMCELKYQLASLGDEISNSKFAMIPSKALPPSY